MDSKKQKKEFYEADSDIASRILLDREVSELTWVSLAHYHNAVELCVLLKGPHGCCVNGEMNYMNEGEIAFIDSFDVHYFDIRKNSERVAVVIDKSFLSDFYSIYKNKELHPCFAKQMNNPESNAKIIPLILDWVDNFEKCNDLQNRGYINLIFGTIANEYGVNYSDDHDDGLVSSVLKYLNDNFKEELTLAKIARQFGCSRNIISRTIHSSIGQDLRTYINQIRVRYADKLLKETAKITVQEAAFQSGFNSMNTFYRAYIKNFGESPRE